MGRAVNLSPMGLYNWDNSVFDFLVLPQAIDRSTLIDNILAETAELEVLYPNPVVFKNLVGVWSAKQVDVWQKLYETTQYEYNPIENYNRYETGSTDGGGSTTHSGTDTNAETTTHGGTDGRTEAITHGGSDRTTYQSADGGTQGQQSSGSSTLSGSDAVTGADTKGHWIAGFDSTASGADDGLVKQTRDQDDSTTTTRYGKVDTTTGSSTTTFGKTESGNSTISYAGTENVTESKTYGETVTRAGNITHGEKVVTTSEGSHTLHAHGNIGVTTTQDMIKQERQIDLFNVYDIIIEDFKMRFCILVY